VLDITLLEPTMANTSRKTPEPTFHNGFEPFFALSAALVANVVQLQRLQLDAWLAWQQSFAAGGQELVDEWACRFGGGVPIDG
jgi:hypothetical protein